MENIGKAVIYTDEKGNVFDALITFDHGQFASDINLHSSSCLNLVHVSGNEEEKDTYGRQIKHVSSVSHKAKVGDTPGRFWQGKPGTTVVLD